MKILLWSVLFMTMFSNCLSCERQVEDTSSPYVVICKQTEENDCQCHREKLIHKRSLRENEVIIYGNACSLSTFDNNNDEKVEKQEFVEVFGANVWSERLFKKLDTQPNDGIITFHEFYALAPKYITGCWRS